MLSNARNCLFFFGPYNTFNKLMFLTGRKMCNFTGVLLGVILSLKTEISLSDTLTGVVCVTSQNQKSALHSYWQMQRCFITAHS